MSVVTTKAQVLELDGITNVTVDNIVDDGDGAFIRAIKFFGDAGPESQPLLEVRIRSEVSAQLNVSTPVLEF